MRERDVFSGHDVNNLILRRAASLRAQREHGRNDSRIEKSRGRFRNVVSLIYANDRCRAGSFVNSAAAAAAPIIRSRRDKYRF